MNISSAFSSGLNGIQDASAQMSNVSSRIAGAGISAEDNENQDTPENLSSFAESESTPLTADLVNLKISEFQAKSSAKIITTADEVLGTLINTSV